jgi:hypothetical protein
MKPRISCEHEEIQGYYDLEDLDIPNIKSKIKVIECDNRAVSYGQFIRCLEIHQNDFDYHIFVEDDYVPSLQYFDLLLVSECLNRLPGKTKFLCAGIIKANETTYYERYEPLSRGKLKCADFSLGILDRATAKTLFAEKTADELIAYMEQVNAVEIQQYQVNFSGLLHSLNIDIIDWNNDYLSIFYETCVCQLYYLNFFYPNDWHFGRRSSDCEKIYYSPIFLPLQMLYLAGPDVVRLITKQYLIDDRMIENYNELQGIIVGSKDCRKDGHREVSSTFLPVSRWFCMPQQPRPRLVRLLSGALSRAKRFVAERRLG